MTDPFTVLTLADLFYPLRLSIQLPEQTDKDT
jgi:hypothetical protein